MRSSCPKCGYTDGKKDSSGELYACGKCDWYTTGYLPYRAGIKVGRNEPCWCGSDKKFKRCCGTSAAKKEK